MYSACKLNRQGDNIQPWHISFPFLNQSAVPCPVPILNIASCPAYMFLWKRVRWSGISMSLKNFPWFVVIHTVKGFSVVNEVNVLLEFPCFFNDPADVGNFISGSSAFSKSSLYIWNFSVHLLLKPSLKDLEHNPASMWNECTCAVVWTFFETGMKTDLFQSCGHCWVFQICWHIECSTLTASYFRIWSSSAGILSPPQALCVVMLPKALLLHTLECLTIGEWSHYRGYPGH